MTNEHQSVEQLFEAALALPKEQRRGFLDRACSGAPLLHHLMEQLIEADGIPDSFLRTPVFQGNGQTSTTNSPLPRSLEGPPRFGVEDVIADRFKVVRFIARGGMGEVYEVQDRFLQGTPLALKIIRPNIAADPYSSRRFEQEVILARKVNHRNLCPIYDIFHCEQPEPPFLFLTMKLLAGESLEARLRRHEVIPLDEGVKVCGQLIEGIEAIHSVGIIHRDIKPNNVMLERVGGETCVTIMDFGLARLNEPDASLSRTGVVAGTPGYLAPELIRGASPSNASDLYALGVVLHQVLTGHRPSPTNNGRAAIISPELQASRAPTGLVYAVAEFLSEDPERRCSAFEQRVHLAEVPGEHPKSRLLSRRSFAVGSAAALCCLGGGTVWQWRKIDDLMHPLPTKRFVALLNWPPPTDVKVTPILLSIIDSMTNALARAEALDRNFFVTCQRTLTEMKTPEQMDQVCETLGANLILAASGSIVDGTIYFALKVIAKDSAKVLRTRQLHIPLSEQFSLPEMATRAAAELLDIPAVSVGGLADDPGTRNQDALAVFQAAEAKMKEPNDSGLSAAIENFKRAVELDARFANAHARLAVAYLHNYVASRDAATLMLARANAETALNLDAELVEGHAALALIDQTVGDLTGALREIGRALSPDPSDSRIAIYQAQIYFFLNRWQDAENTFLRVLKGRPNYWLAYHWLGNNYSFQGKYRLALQAFQAAGITDPLNALAAANIAIMLLFLGNLDQAEVSIARSLALSENALALQTRADILLVRNKLTDSLKAAQHSTELSPNDNAGWLRVGDAYGRMKHRERQALSAYQRALTSAAEDLRVDPHTGSNWMLMALYECKTGDLVAAKASLKNADDKGAIDIYSLIYRVRILELLTRREEALATLSACIRMGATATQIRSTNDLDGLLSDPRCPKPASTTT